HPRRRPAIARARLRAPYGCARRRAGVLAPLDRHLGPHDPGNRHCGRVGRVHFGSFHLTLTFRSWSRIANAPPPLYFPARGAPTSLCPASRAGLLQMSKELVEELLFPSSELHFACD